MVKELIHDPIFLAQKSSPADESDRQTAQDLLDTIIAHKDECVGMAANMIGVKKRVIVFNDSGAFRVMFNPEIIGRFEPYKTAEGCLSLLGEPRPTTRYKKIKVRYLNEEFKPRIKTFTGFTAQIIQHETDHCDGILI
ncbi:MAG: peptide deformylase [Oscillospiraceae bacterium]|nr:peptide deformylase [Oscillospiraceae bacterium]